LVKLPFRPVLDEVAVEIRRFPTLYVFRRPAILLLAGLAAALLALERSGRLARPSALDAARFAGTPAAVIGVVVEPPDLRPSGCVYIIEAETLAPIGEHAGSVSGRLLLHVIGAAGADAGPGDRVRAFGRVRLPECARSPGAFDYRAYLATRGIHALVYAGERGFESLGNSGSRRLAAAGWRLRHAVAQAFERRMPGDRAIVLAGLTVGQRPRFHPEVRRAFVESGTMHVLVASGSNVGFILAGWLILAAVFGFSRKAALLTALPAVWGYVLVVGGDAPIARAGTMATVAIAAYALAREDRPVHALTVAALARLATNPLSLFDVGFQMSFVTVLGLMHHLPRLEPWVSQRPAWARWPLRLLFAGLIAHLWLLPISAGVFHRTQLWGLAANLVIVPLAGAGLAIGLALAGLDALASVHFGFELAARAAAAAASAHAGLLTRAAEWFAALGPAVWLPMPSLTGVAAYYGVCLAVPFALRSWLARGAVAGGLALMVFRGWAPLPLAARDWGVAWVDVGPRFAAVLIDHDRSAVIVNPGPSDPADSSERTLAPFLAVSRIQRIAAVVVTDPRVSAADVSAFTRQMPVERVISSTAMAGGAFFTAGGFSFRVLPATAYAGQTPLWVERGGRAVLLAHRVDLETQGAALNERAPLEAVQARFSPDAVWSPDFLRRHRPAVVVETAGESRESVSPWRRAQLVRPHSNGWAWWEGASATAEKKDAEKAGDKAARVGPPRDAAGVAAHGLGGQRAEARDGLRQKPETQKKVSRHLDEADEEDEDEKREHLRPRIENEVAAENPRDRARRPHHR